MGDALTSLSPATRRGATDTYVYVQRWKQLYVLGSPRHSLLAKPARKAIHSSPRQPVKACSRSSESTADGVLLSALRSGRQTAQLVRGTTGLLLIAGTLGIAAKIIWQKASQVASLPPTYEAILEFPFASGIAIGTVVRIRGVEVGSVIHVRPCLERIDAKIQVMDARSYIPGNALVEVNQSGLVGETVIDITPVSPIPRPSVGPLDPACPSEGLIICDKERIRGQQGVSMDDLMRLCGKLAKDTQESNVRDFFKTARQLDDAVGSSGPLLEKVEKFADSAEPVIKQLQDGRHLSHLRELLKEATHIARNHRTSSLIMEHERSFPNSVANLATKLSDLERASEEMTSVLKVEKNRKNMKHLVELLSRLVDG